MKRIRDMRLTPLHAHSSIHPLIITRPNTIVRKRKHPGHRTIIRDNKMIRRARTPRPLQVILILNRGLRRIKLVENPLLRRLASVQIQVVEEGRDGVVGEFVGGELHGFVLGGAFEDAEVAVGAGVGLGGGLGVDAHGEGEVDFAVAVVFVVVRWVAEVAGGWGGED